MIVTIVGPTGVGKTKLSIELAKHYNPELISGDSVQVYKELNIGSAKISKEEMNGVKHHMIDVLSVKENFSVAVYQKMVRQKIKDFEEKTFLPISVGGTGLYIKSVLYNYNFEDTKRDHDFENKMHNVDNETLHQYLEKSDPKRAENIHPNNRKRVLQALRRADNHKVSSETAKDEEVYDFIMIGLTMDREELYQRINTRVDQMITDGLVDEVRNLYDQHIHTSAIQAIGYKELYQYFDGEASFEEAVNNIKTKSRQFAKRQFTFFHNQFDVHWIDVDVNDFEQTLKDAIHYIDTQLGEQHD
jgi:tRNA dimethylallyltransferase